MKFVEYDLTEFVNATFSNSPVPGGGGVSALASSLGTALGGMVLNLTVGKEKYAQYDEELSDIVKRMNELKDGFLELVDKDSEGFFPLSQAYKLPSSTEDERIYKHKIMQDAIKTACESPVMMVKKSCEAIDLLSRLQGKTVMLAVSDIAVGMILLRAGLVGAWMNVLTNLSSIEDEEYKNAIRSSLIKKVHEGVAICDKVCDDIEKILEDNTGGNNG